MDKPRTLIFVGAHPDDETFGNGGTIAHYVAAGVKVYYICGTKGEVGPADERFMEGYETPGDMRWAELKCASEVLGLSDVIHLGYRDSGMQGSEDNTHPNALAAAPVEEVAMRIVKIFRELKPDVVVTFDPIGGYFHPDHIAIHNAAVNAFHASGDSKQYPEAGPAFQPQKLYFSVFPNTSLRIMVRLMPLFGRNPHKFGRNQDIDLTEIVKKNFPVHAVVKLDHKFVEVREKASACHASQLGGGPPRSWLFRLFDRMIGQKEMFMRDYPPVPLHFKKEKDLFQGIK